MEYSRSEQNPERLYPDHLYNPTRRQIALELVEKEFNKQLKAAGTGRINAEKWAARFDDHTFWNAIEGFMGGTLIKPIVHFLTAHNYEWSRQTVAVADIRLSSKLDQLNRLEGLDPHQLDLAKIKEKLDNDPAEAAHQKQITESFSQDETQNTYLPIIVEKDGRLMVMDGNRRCLRALFNGQETIDVWYCRTNNEPPVDFWFPINEMMDLVRTYNYGKQNNPGLRDIIQATLTEVFRQSKVAEIAYRERIISYGTRGAEELLDES